MELESLFNQETEPVKETPSPEKPEEKPEEGKAEETPVEEKKEEEKPAEEKVSEPEKSTVPAWESDDNPYKKRYQDTAGWATNVNKENLDLKKQIAQGITDIHRKLDGTYEPPAEGAANPDVEKFQADYTGRVEASLQAAAERFGEAEVNRLVLAPDAPFQKLKDHPVVSVRLLNSKLPVIEAMNIVAEEEFKAKYGNTPEKIRESFRKELEPEIREQVAKEFKDKLKRKEEQPTTLAGARAAAVPKDNSGGYKSKSTDALFSQ